MMEWMVRGNSKAVATSGSMVATDWAREDAGAMRVRIPEKTTGKVRRVLNMLDSL
jgi:hypothetical protein